MSLLQHEHNRSHPQMDWLHCQAVLKARSLLVLLLAKAAVPPNCPAERAAPGRSESRKAVPTVLVLFVQAALKVAASE